MEKSIRAMVKMEKGLTFGYIGNLEPWGDDRKLMIWDDQNCKIWTAEAKRLNNGDFKRAIDSIALYRSRSN